MDHEIVKMREDTWRVEDEGVRFFVLAGREKAILIDSGRETPEARRIAESLTRKPLMMLCTHGDRDHISGNGGFETVMMHPGEFAFYRHNSRHANSLVPVREGDVIGLGDRDLEIIELPGHTPGSIAVLDRRERVLISGDPIQRGGRIFMWGAQRDMEAYLYSLRCVEKRVDDFDEIWPSHGEIPIAPGMIRDLAEKTEAVMAGKLPGRDEELHGNLITAYDFGDNVLLVDRNEGEKYRTRR